MKLAIIGTDGLPARYGGFETFAMEVSPRIASLGHEVLVVGSSVGRPSQVAALPGVKIRNLPLKANGIASIPFDLASFATVCRWADAILLLGVSAGPFVPLMRRLTRGKSLVVNVDGLESRREKWSPMSRRYLAFAEKVAIHGAQHVVADNKAIADIIETKYGRRATIIAYGNDHVRPIDEEGCRNILANSFSLEPDGYFLTVARIEPENNIAMMLDAIPDESKIPYVIVGNFATSDYGRELMRQYRGVPWVRFISATYDPQELAALRAGCRAYLHGHSVGGTNPSLVEMLPYDRPLLVYDCSFNRETLNEDGAFFGSSEQLQGIILANSFDQYTPPATLRADSRYQWQMIAEQYAALAFGE
ncbi:Glycosyltransferase involved in cell wall bisynthesis [Sphingomonas laterariae]|uniref:Glycosyltransferase involved in cell wall bisynthesis n=1 Tax=Edaphosphingomonas laterariae TaxID=861865 RepID=A0A239JXE9_9SPHN|nr:DUF1972 domain-containing protein [Sphingomonas laterariae]SNT10152.1 Glycosyltransferase involved in cell wall bisynthesis [Sphingomonas laterariae]